MWFFFFYFFLFVCFYFFFFCLFVFFFQAEDGIRDLVRSRGLGDVYKRQVHARPGLTAAVALVLAVVARVGERVSAVLEVLVARLVGVAPTGLATARVLSLIHI